MWVGSSAGGYDKGILRLRKVPTSTKFFVGEESDVKWADNDYLTVLADFDLWARHLTLSGSTILMDGDIAYSDQHTNFSPVPIMGSHQVLELIGASVSCQWNASASWVLDSTISSYAWACATASSSSGTTTATPTFGFNTLGWHLVYLTVTAANGKSTTGVRLVYVWDQGNQPMSAEFGTAYCDFDAGGWQFPVTMYAGASLDDIHDRTLVILFAEDHYGGTDADVQSIGPLTGCENIRVIGRISGESIEWDPEQGKVTFTVHGSQHWFAQMKGFPSGLKMVTTTPASWIEIRSLTVKRALFHFLYWRTTAMRVMDVYLTDDSRLLKEVNALGAKLWTQMTEFAFNTILANLGVDRFGRLFCEIDPQMIPAASRSGIPVVMTITKKDWQEIDPFPRRIIEETGLIDLSGVSVNESGYGSSFFSLSPGHVMKRFGEDDVVDHLAAHDTQAENNQLAGLLLGWRINALPRLDIKLSGNHTLFDCYPNQFAEITIAEDDTPRGMEYSGHLIPRYVALQPPDDNGFAFTEIAFEAETFEENSTNGDIPFGPSNTSIPPVPNFPPIPLPPIVIPGVPPINVLGEGPPIVLVHDTTYGLLYSDNFDDSGANVKWRTVNAGLTQAQYQQINMFKVLPSGAIYVAHCRRTGFGTTPFIAYAPYIGGTFTIIEDGTSIAAKFPAITPILYSVLAIGINPLNGQVAYIIGVDNNFGTQGTRIYVGSGTSFTPGIDLSAIVSMGAESSLSFGAGNWRLTTATGIAPKYLALSADGGTIIRNVSMDSNSRTTHVPISTSDAVYILNAGGSVRKITQNGAVAGDFTTAIGSLLNNVDRWDVLTACDPTGLLTMSAWDTGNRGRSSDGFATISGIPNLPFGGAYCYDWAGGGGAQSRWIAGKGIVRYSPDRGDIWLNKEGNINLVAPLLSINVVKVIGF